MHEILNLFGICLHGSWTDWSVWDGSRHRAPRAGERAVSHCRNCNHPRHKNF